VDLIGYALFPTASARFPSVLDLGLVLFYPLVFAALVAFVRQRVSRFAGVLWLDCALGALTLATVGVLAVWPHLDGQRDAAVIGQLMYLVGDLGLLGFFSPRLR
jgi:uncharacterized membrane protein YjjP (DUF1212 family)